MAYCTSWNDGQSAATLRRERDSGKGLSCQYPGCSEVCAVGGSGRLLACCDVHHKEEESQLRQFQEGSGGQRGDNGQRGDSGQSGDNGQSGDVVVREVTVVRVVTMVAVVTMMVRGVTVAVGKVMAVTRLLAAVVREVNTALRVIIVVLEDVTKAAKARSGSEGLLSPSLTTMP